jgi:hypothetical protein
MQRLPGGLYDLARKKGACIHNQEKTFSKACQCCCSAPVLSEVNAVKFTYITGCEKALNHIFITVSVRVRAFYNFTIR